MSQFPLPICYSGSKLKDKPRARPYSRALCLLAEGIWEPGMTEQSTNEFICASNLDNRHRGQLAEIAFVRKATTLGFAVAKPWGEGERYDFIVRVQNVCWRVQVKSVLAKTPGRPHYRINLRGNARSPSVKYSANDIDFLIAYIFQEDTWYVFPASIVEPRILICVRPGSKQSRFEAYREAWELLKPKAPEATEPDRASVDGEARTTSTGNASTAAPGRTKSASAGT